MLKSFYQIYARKTLTLAVALAIVAFWTLPLRLFALDPSKNLQQYVLRTWTTEQGLPQNTIHAMLQTRDGFLWIGTRGGLARFDGANFTLYKPGAPNSIPGESITGLVEDRDGSLWISSDGGLSHYRDGSFRNFSSRDGLPENSIWRIAKDNAGGVWAVTRRSQLFHFDGKTVLRCDSPFTGRPQDVNAMAEDTQGILWIATFHGLFVLNPDHSFRRFARREGLAGDRVYALALNHKGQLWAAGDGGLTQIAPQGLSHIEIPELTTATLLAFDPSGSDDDTIWTGSTGQGLFRLNLRGVQRLRAAHGLVSDDIYLLSCSRDGSLWIGALNGLNELSDGVITSYSTSEGLPASTLGTQRAQGPNDALWFGHGRFMAHVRDGKLAQLSGAFVAAPKRLEEKGTITETSRGLEAVRYGFGATIP